MDLLLQLSRSRSSAADVMQLAMARVHAALEGSDARLILQVHDELVVEAPEDTARCGRGAGRAAHDGRLARAVSRRPEPSAWSTSRSGRAGRSPHVAPQVRPLPPSPTAAGPCR